MPRIRNYRDLEVWQRSMDLAVGVYKLTADFPVAERFGLTAQIRRAAVGVPANISEGAGRIGVNEYRHFVSIARGSNCELDTCLDLAQRLQFGAPEQSVHLRSMADEVSRMLLVLARNLRNSR